MTGGENCERCRKAASAGTLRDDPESAAHLEQCAECRDFAEFTERVMACEPVIPGPIPTLAHIRGVMRRKLVVHRLVWPLALAASLALVSGVAFFRMERPTPAEESSYIGGLVEKIQLENADYNLSMTWDTVSAGETQLKNSLAALRSAGSWNIEAFNPVTEEL